jgi:hypothetical protein
VPYYVLLGGSRNGERIISDHELIEHRLPSRQRNRSDWSAPAPLERYRITSERCDGFTVMSIVRAAAATRITMGYATSN